MFEYNLTYLTLYHRENLNVLTTTVSSSATTLSVSSRIVSQWLNLVTSSRLRGDYQVIHYQDPLLSYFPFYPCSHLFFTLEFCVGVTFMSTAVLKNNTFLTISHKYVVFNSFSSIQCTPGSIRNKLLGAVIA